MNTVFTMDPFPKTCKYSKPINSPMSTTLMVPSSLDREHSTCIGKQDRGRVELLGSHDYLGAEVGLRHGFLSYYMMQLPGKVQETVHKANWACGVKGRCREARPAS